MKPIVVFGAQGHAKVVVEAIEHRGSHRIAGFVAEGPLGFTSPYPMLGGDVDVRRLWNEIGPFDGHIAVGDVTIRRRIAERLSREMAALVFPPIVHPLARLAKWRAKAPRPSRTQLSVAWSSSSPWLVSGTCT